LGTFAICRVENLLCEVRLLTLAEMRERDTAKTAITILTNSEHPTRHLCTSQIYDHYATKPSTPKPMFIRAMEYLGRFGIDTKKIEPTSIFMRPPWKEMDEDRDDLILTGIPMDQEVKGSGGRLRKYYKKYYEIHVKIYTDGSKKDERAGYAVITPNRTYRRRVQQQSTVFSTEQEAIIKVIWLTEGTQRDKVIITDSLSTQTAINGNNHTKNPKTIKLREMMDRNKNR
jgi:hypothetical protein